MLYCFNSDRVLTLQTISFRVRWQHVLSGFRPSSTFLSVTPWRGVFRISASAATTLPPSHVWFIPVSTSPWPWLPPPAISSVIGCVIIAGSSRICSGSVSGARRIWPSFPLRHITLGATQPNISAAWLMLRLASQQDNLQRSKIGLNKKTEWVSKLRTSKHYEGYNVYNLTTAVIHHYTII